jgi:REP element-mobilizing transposase RayT
MSTYTQLLYQIVFSTKERNPVLAKPNRARLFRYISGILKNKNCHVYIINGVEDHIHILTHIHQSIAIADLVKDIKVASNLFINNKIYLVILRIGKKDMVSLVIVSKKNID